MALNKKSSLILDSARRRASAGLMALNKKSSLILDSARRPASAGLMAWWWWWCGGVVWRCLLFQACSLRHSTLRIVQAGCQQLK